MPAALVPAYAPAVAAPLPLSAIAIGVALVAVAIAAAVAANLPGWALTIAVAVAAVAVAAGFAAGAVGGHTAARTLKYVDATAVAAALEVPVTVAVPVARISAVEDGDANAVAAVAAAPQTGIAVLAILTGLATRRQLDGNLAGGVPGNAEANEPGGEALQRRAPAALRAETARQGVERLTVHFEPFSLA